MTKFAAGDYVKFAQPSKKFPYMIAILHHRNMVNGDFKVKLYEKYSSASRLYRFSEKFLRLYATKISHEEFAILVRKL
ncbi:Uncharacterised protein [uncultured archaeon]|nr:Uncharacterised protein [uncultured archaeon]